MSESEGPVTTEPLPSQPCPDCGCQLDLHSGDEEGGPEIPYCIECEQQCTRAKATPFAAAFARWRELDMELVDVALDDDDMYVLVDALECWQAHGCPVISPLLTASPPSRSKIEALKELLWSSDKVIVRGQRAESRRILNGDEA